MNTIRFRAGPRPDLGGEFEVVPVIDGSALTDLIDAFESQARMEPSGGYGGLVPAHFNFGPLVAHFLGDCAAKSSKTPLLGCDCGEWGCWPLPARIVATDDTVTWTDFEQPHRRDRDYSDFGPFSFDRNQYQNALTILDAALTA